MGLTGMAPHGTDVQFKTINEFKSGIILRLNFPLFLMPEKGAAL